MAKRGRKPLNSTHTPTPPEIPVPPPSPPPPPPKPAFEPVTMHYRGITKVVTTKEHLDAEIARGKWKPIEGA